MVVFIGCGVAGVSGPVGDDADTVEIDPMSKLGKSIDKIIINVSILISVFFDFAMILILQIFICFI